MSLLVPKIDLDEVIVGMSAVAAFPQCPAARTGLGPSLASLRVPASLRAILPPQLPRPKHWQGARVDPDRGLCGERALKVTFRVRQSDAKLKCERERATQYDHLKHQKI
jgi:hypothetical protein